MNVDVKSLSTYENGKLSYSKVHHNPEIWLILGNIDSYFNYSSCGWSLHTIATMLVDYLPNLNLKWLFHFLF